MFPDPCLAHCKGRKLGGGAGNEVRKEVTLRKAWASISVALSCEYNFNDTVEA